MRTVKDEFSVKKYKVVVLDGSLPYKDFNCAIIDGNRYKITIPYDIKNSIAIETEQSMIGKNVEFD